jgi:SAM-dependent methyltransferase
MVAEVTRPQRTAPTAKQRAYSVGLQAYRQYRWYSSPERMRMKWAVRDWIRRLRPTGTLLEVGGGTSMLRDLIEEEAPGIHYVSSDIAPTNVTAVVLDGTDLPMRKASIDVVLALEVLEHVPDPRKMLLEFDRVLKSGGVVILTVPFMYGLHDFRDYYRYTPLGLETLLAGSRLELRETKLRGGTFVTATGLFKQLIRNTVLGDPGGWRAQGRRKKQLWLLIILLELPLMPLMWASMALDSLFDRNSHCPPGFFFLCVKND